MTDPTKLPKFSSCRGVPSRSNPRRRAPLRSHRHRTTKRKPERPMGLAPVVVSNTTSTVVPSANSHRSMSRASSHFCDLSDDDKDDKEEHRVDDIEAQLDDEQPAEPKKQQEQPILVTPPGSASVKKPTPPPPQEYSRLAVVLLDQGLFTVYKLLFAARSSASSSGSPSSPRPRVGPDSGQDRRHGLPPILGGVHSGCGVSSFAWLVYALILTLRRRSETSPEIIAAASSVLALLSLSCVAAFPLVRHLHHNLHPDTKSYHRINASELAKQQEFWITVLITFFTILPWATVRRVPVSVTAPSGHASIVKFSGGVKAGLLGRISRSPLSEWHAFGIISDGEATHMMLAGAVGDFTKGLVSDLPQRLWVRRVHFAGLPYLVNMYGGWCSSRPDRGSACSCPSCCSVRGGGVRGVGGERRGGELWEGDYEYGHRRWRSRVGGEEGGGARHGGLGRPNVAEMAVEAAKEWEAEVVVVTSNPQGSRDVVRACKKAGIPAFGPIWDS
uniref:Uncharacterized protein n=1 Tax=Ananas comosus var. bracteatus TaxID=296719 RepID=A0A6V7NZM7_ANACO|nr:unnamed protein product [Ananas comosus var. bracteatus]